MPKKKKEIKYEPCIKRIKFQFGSGAVLEAWVTKKGVDVPNHCVLRSQTTFVLKQLKKLIDARLREALKKERLKKKTKDGGKEGADGK